ncbi:MAG: pilus assembly protein [Alphaproteobacteria bacterium]|nr:pilus assembly protein [Alphaproteobacteria bacterium]
MRASLFRGIRRIGGEQGGVAAVEFALVMPILLLLLFGSIELGRLMRDYHVASKGVRDAGRFLSRVPASCTAPGAGTIAADELTRARNLALTGRVQAPSTPGDYLLPYWTDPASIAIEVDCVANDGSYAGLYAASAFIARLTVTATVPFTFVSGYVFAEDGLNFSIAHNQVSVGE